MSTRVRVLLFSLGIVITLCSLTALVYAFWPVQAVEVQATLAPTLFAPP